MVKALILNILLQLLLEGIMTGYLGFKLKHPALAVVKKMLPTVLVAGAANSGAAAYTDKVNTCEHDLGIQKNFTDFFLPLAQILFQPGSLASFSLLFSYFTIPQEGLALCLAVVVLNSFFSTAFNTYGNLVLAITTGRSLDVVDDRKLLPPKTH